jgi:hypothetical protein
MERKVSARIDSPKQAPREGLRVDFHGVGDTPNAHAVTDAGGVFVVDLPPGEYLIPSSNAFTVNGQPFPAGTTFRLIVPEGAGPVDVTSEAVEIMDLSPPGLMAMIDALQLAQDALTARVTALETQDA